MYICCNWGCFRFSACPTDTIWGQLITYPIYLPPFCMLQEGGLIKETWMNEDPREAILKYADAAEKDPKFIAPAYSQTQPKPVFAESDSDNEEK